MPKEKSIFEMNEKYLRRLESKPLNKLSRTELVLRIVQIVENLLKSGTFQKFSQFSGLNEDEIRLKIYNMMETDKKGFGDLVIKAYKLYLIEEEYAMQTH